MKLIDAAIQMQKTMHMIQTNWGMINLWEGGFQLRQSFRIPLALLLLLFICSFVVSANEPSEESSRMHAYLKFENIIVPWYYLAAVDQFERNIQLVRNDIPKKDSTIAIQFPNEYWTGALNPYKEDTAPQSIAFFFGEGLDGNGDGLADPQNDEDVLYTMTHYLSKFGPAEKDFLQAVEKYYEREETVKQINTIAQIYKNFETVDLNERAFPLAQNHHYSYRGTWGASRGWGGRRIHEGTDLFASYGVPVQSTSYGVVEVMGWNEFGGWRVGIRDHHNTYHYYAHLANYEKGIKQGDIVKPGEVIGYVGNSGYGKEGTSGKFPPHLHYGMYKYNGKTEWAFDPHPFLKQWE